MVVLVDYDNILELDRNRGPVHVATKIIEALGTALNCQKEVNFRLYGGWFQGTILSRRAQLLTPVLRASFPRPMALAAGVVPSPITARAELALALEAAPGRHLTHTYRDRALPNNVKCAALPYPRCHQPGACPIAPTHSLFRDARCPELGCPVGIETVITKPEQKLIDTMITADLLHLALSDPAVVVVSADDDIWPGIQAALVYGAKILHVHPLPGRTTPMHYATLATGHYIQSSF